MPQISLINLSGGIGIPYYPDDEPADIMAIGEGVRQAFRDHGAAGLGDVAIVTELGRYILGPTDAWLQRQSARRKSTRTILALTHVQPTLCGRRCMVPTTISLWWVKKMLPQLIVRCGRWLVREQR